MRLYDAINATWDMQQRADTLRSAIDGAASGAPDEVTAAASTLKTAIDAVAGPGRGKAPTFRALNRTLSGQLIAQDKGDHQPTAPTVAAYNAACRDLTSAQAQWGHVVDGGLSAFNVVLTRHGRRPIVSQAETLVGCRPL